MKKTMLLAVMFVLTLAGYAQDAPAKGGKTPEERATQFTAWIDQTVQLTPDQKTKVQACNLKYAQMKATAKTTDQNDRQAMRKDMMEDNQEQEAELKGILTADQYTAYTAAKKQKREDMRAKRKAN
jgi:protein CpxP